MFNKFLPQLLELSVSSQCAKVPFRFENAARHS